MKKDDVLRSTATPKQWLHSIWLAQPVADLPPAPAGYNVQRAISLGWLIRSDDGWRVAPGAPIMFEWK